MGQHGKPQNDRQFRGPQDAPTTSLPTHRVGPLGSLHDNQRRWHPFGRVLWWALLLPLAIFAWSSWRLRGVLRVGGYILAGWVLIFGLAVVSAPAAPQTTAAPVPVGQAASAPTSAAPVAAPVTVAPAALPVAPAAVVAPPAPVPPVVAAPTHTARPAAPKPSPPKLTPARTAAAPASGNAYGDTYTNVDGNQVQRPVAAASRPAGATAQCKDGTWSFSQHRSGTCSGHGGIA